MIIKLTKHGRGDVRKAIQYVLQEKNSKGEKREKIELIYGNPQELLVIANSTEFKQKVKLLKYFSGVIALPEGERLTEEQIQFLVSNFGKTLNNLGQTDIPFIIVKHIEYGKEHYHFIGLRYDLNTRAFSNPFRPRWEKKWISWAKWMESQLGLKHVERKRSWIEREFYETKLLMQRNPSLIPKLEKKLELLKFAYLVKSFNLGVDDGDERLKRVLSKADRYHPELNISTDAKEDGQLLRIIRTEIERDRKHNEKYRTVKNTGNSEYIIERGSYYPISSGNTQDIRIWVRRAEKEQIRDGKNELETFKKEINLVDFCVSNGAKVLKRSSPNSFRISWGGEKFLVSKNERGHWLFQGIDDETKRGSIVDLCNLLGMRNLGEIRKRLRLYLQTQKKKEEVGLKEEVKKEIKEEVKKDNWRERVRLFDNPEKSDIWSERGINPYKHKLGIFLKNIYTDDRNNLLFPIYDYEGQIVGFEVKGRRGFKMNIGSKQGLAIIGNNNLLNERIVITESAFDALAYEQLHPSPRGLHTLYISTSGQLTEKQMQQLRKMIEFKKIGALKEVILAFDNDEQGRKYAEKLKQYLEDLEIDIIEHYSNAKDWNDELKLMQEKSGEIELQELQEEKIKWEMQWQGKRSFRLSM